MTITVNMHEAKTHLSRLVARAAQGEEVVIARAGRPLVRLVAVAAPERGRRLGFLQGQAVARADLKAAFADDIDAMFSGR